MIVDTITKQPSEEFSFGVLYDPSMADGEYIDTAKVTASLEDDQDSDQTAAVLDNIGGPPPDADLVEGTATAGGSNYLEDSAINFSIAGVRPGLKMLNETKNFVVVIKTIEQTAAGWTRVTFEDAPRDTEIGDQYRFLFAKARLKGGVDGQNYRVTYLVTTSESRVFEDDLIMKVRQV